MKSFMSKIVFALCIGWVSHTCVAEVDESLTHLRNFQVNSANMVSSGQPNNEHFLSLKTMGVTHVIDLIPGDRSEESALVTKLGLNYHNIPVDWEAPSIDDFNRYVLLMQKDDHQSGITLTHCRLNWRGAVFTYLYRVTQLQHEESVARQDLYAVWTPNDTWQAFIDNVRAQY